MTFKCDWCTLCCRLNPGNVVLLLCIGCSTAPRVNGCNKRLAEQEALEGL
jgi:hypothetical protein